MRQFFRKTVCLSLAVICLGISGCQARTEARPGATVAPTNPQSTQSTAALRPTASLPSTTPSPKPVDPSVTTVSPAPTARPTDHTTTIVDHGPVRDPAIVVYKSDRVLELWDGETLYDRYRIGLGFTPVGHKQVEGDGKTPEGDYYVCTRNSNSRFYLSLGVSYPSTKDAKAGLDAGRIDQMTERRIREAIESRTRPPWNTPLGGEIMIHGHGGRSDWTAGCIAVDNAVMDILWKYCPLKTPITIHP